MYKRTHQLTYFTLLIIVQYEIKIDKKSAFRDRKTTKFKKDCIFSLKFHDKPAQFVFEIALVRIGNILILVVREELEISYKLINYYLLNNYSFKSNNKL